MRPASMPGLLAITFTATVVAAQAPPSAPATILAYAIAGTTPAGVTQLAPGSNYNAKGSNKVKRTDKARYEVASPRRSPASMTRGSRSTPASRSSASADRFASTPHP